MPTQLFSLGQILEPLTSPLESWLGPEALENWLATLKPLPYCGRLFLEFHPALSSPRCDVIIGVLASDGSLSGWIEQGPQDSRPIWNKTRALLKKWHRQLGSQQGALAAYCFMVWLEFDICATQIDAGDPSIFIALTPQADVARIADELGDYPELRDAITGFKATIARHSNIQKIVQADPLVLGHIGYMASRQRDNVGLALRSCWRCEDLGAMHRLLRATNIPINYQVLSEQTLWLERIAPYTNSIMLHLDSHQGWLPKFSVEVNVFNPYASSPEIMEKAVLQTIVDAGFMLDHQKTTLAGLSAAYSFAPLNRLRCSMHHFKLQFIGSIIQEVKCYWSVR